MSSFSCGFVSKLIHAEKVLRSVFDVHLTEQIQFHFIKCINPHWLRDNPLPGPQCLCFKYIFPPLEPLVKCNLHSHNLFMQCSEVINGICNDRSRSLHREIKPMSWEIKTTLSSCIILMQPTEKLFLRDKFVTSDSPMKTVWPVAVLSASQELLTDYWIWAQTRLNGGRSQCGLHGLKASVAQVTWQVILKRTAVHDILFPVEDSNEWVSLLCSRLFNSLSASECLRFMIPTARDNMNSCLVWHSNRLKEFYVILATGNKTRLQWWVKYSLAISLPMHPCWLLTPLQFADPKRRFDLLKCQHVDPGSND